MEKEFDARHAITINPHHVLPFMFHKTFIISRVFITVV